MTFFFLVVGLEAKRELDLGELRERRRLAIPLVAALGGMALPILIYLAFNAGGSGAHGWGAAMSTDTAFALGVLALVAPGGTRLRVLLLTLAIFDDLMALLVIATVYTEHVSVVPLLVAVGLFGVLFALRYAPIAWRRPAAAIAGRGDLGRAVRVRHRSGDRRPRGRPRDERLSAARAATSSGSTELTRSFREQPTPELARSAQLSVASAISANERLQYRLHPWTSYVIVPLFALANAGIHLDRVAARRRGHARRSRSESWSATWSASRSGSSAAAWLASRSGLGGMRRTLSWPAIAGGGAVRRHRLHRLAADLEHRLRGQQLDEAKIGVLGRGGAGSRSLAWMVFRVIARPARDPVRARQLIGTADDDPRPLRGRRPRARSHSRLRARAGDAGRVRRLRVSLLRPGRDGRSASCSTPSATTSATSGATCR